MNIDKPLGPGLFRHMVEHLAEGVVLARLEDGVILYVNPNLAALFRYQPGELPGLPLGILNASITLPWEQTAASIIASIRSRGFWSAEVQHVRKDGSEFWSRVNASIFEDAQHGQVLLSVLQDISPQKVVRDALHESQKLQQRAQRLALIGHWRINPLTSALTGTDELFQIFELPKGSGLDEFNQTVHPEDREGLGKIMEKTLENRGSYDSTYRLITRNNNRKWVHAIGEGSYAGDGTLVEIVGSVQDITAFRNIEEELQKMQKLKSLGIMAGGIAHDFNNIHTTLFGNISMARLKLDQEHPAYADIATAEKALQRATNLSNQLLTFAKGGEPVKKYIQLDKLVGDVSRFDLAGSNVKLDFHASHDLWSVDADAGQMEQVFANLVINAYQSMPNGGSLHIGLDNVCVREGEGRNLDAGNYVRITIRDEGEGIPADYLHQIFDPYFSTKKGGSGLGLATVYSIVKKHGGYIDVVSKPATGTTFVIYLPAAAPREAEANKAVLAKPVLAPRSGKILVMDDEKDLGELARKILDIKGYQVELSLNGVEALAKYAAAQQQGAPFDCVIMDLTIPGEMGGKEALREILKLDPDARTIVSSGYAVDPVMASYREYGFRGVLPKPYTPAELLEVVATVLAATAEQASK